MGELERPWEFIWIEEEDFEEHVVLLKTTIEDKDVFFTSVRQRIIDSTRNDAFIFVHCYNVTFPEAARRTAQMAYDLGFAGAPVFYSWPSAGRLLGYFVDGANIEWAQPRLRGFLGDFLSRTDADRIYLIAHSMGNRALTNAVTSLLRDRPELGSRIKEIILVAPDIDAETFKEQIAPAMTSAGRPITLYTSSVDVPLSISHHWLHGYPRAGHSRDGIIIMPPIETVDASDVDTSWSGHSYYAGERSVLSDIFYLIQEGQRADQRFGLRRVDSPAGRYWVFRK
jgi:esterase/lipase superfamily enzyme